MPNFFDRLFHPEQKSARQAKERLKLVLIHDRTDINPGVLDLLKDDLIQAISRHVEINEEAVHIEITRDGHQKRLIADIPLRASRRRRLG